MLARGQHREKSQTPFTVAEPAPLRTHPAHMSQDPTLPVRFPLLRNFYLTTPDAFQREADVVMKAINSTLTYTGLNP